MVKTQHDAASAIQRSWRKRTPTSFLLNSLSINLKHKVEDVRRRLNVKAATALAVRLNRGKAVVYKTHVSPLLYLRWAIEKPDTLMLWEYKEINNGSSKGVADVLHEAAKAFNDASPVHSKRAYDKYIRKFQAWRELDCSQKSTALKCTIGTHMYAHTFGGLLNLVCLPEQMPRGNLEKMREGYGGMAGPAALLALDKEMGECKTMSTAQITHELLHARRGKELIDPSTGCGYDENACFTMVRLEFPRDMCALIRMDLANRVSQEGPLNCDPLIRALHEIQNTGRVSSIGVGWNVDFVALKAQLTLKPFDAFGDLDVAMETMLAAAKTNVGAGALVWPEEKKTLANTICSKLAFLMRTVGQIQACAFNLRLKLMLQPTELCVVLPCYERPAVVEKTREWLFEAQRFRSGNRDPNVHLRTRDFENGFLNYAITWLVFAGMDGKRQEPETLMLFDEHRLRYLERMLADILTSVGERVKGIWTGSSGGTIFERTLFRHVLHHASGGAEDCFLALLLNKSKKMHQPKGLMAQIKAFTESMKALIKSTTRLYGANAYLPLIEMLFVR